MSDETDTANSRDELDAHAIRMRVVGVGGAGSNMVDRMMLSRLGEMSLAVVNTDQQALAGSPVSRKLCIGKTVTGGLGAGGDVEVGREAALADKDALERLVSDIDLLFIAAGLGGGTGTGAAPVLADLAIRKGVVVIAFVAMPFTVERAARASLAKDGLQRLRDVCNAVIPLPNDLLIQVSEPDASLLDAFSRADEWIERAVSSIWTMMRRAGLINLDFAQLQQAFARKSGKTLFGLGEGAGPLAADEAIESLKLCPLLHTPEFSKKADHLLVNVMGGARLGMADTHKIMSSVAETFGSDANIAMGAVIDEDFGDRVEICVIGTSDVSNIPVSSVPRRPRAPSIPSAAAPEVSHAAFASEKIAPKSVARPRSAKVEQPEFSFGSGDPKGEFENLAGTPFEGQDLDIPTFLRRGVKVAL